MSEGRSAHNLRHRESTMNVTATVTARAAASCVPDQSGAVDADIYADGGDAIDARHAAEDEHADALLGAGADPAFILGEDGIGDAGDRAVDAWFDSEADDDVRERGVVEEDADSAEA